jgi:hypothetical protein
VTSSFSVNSSVTTLDPLLENATFAATQLTQWEFNQTGELSLGAANQLGWLRLPNDASIFKTVKDPSAGPTSAHFEFILTVGCSFLSMFFSDIFSCTNRMNFCPLLHLSRRAAISLPCSLILYLRLLVSHFYLNCMMIIDN